MLAIGVLKELNAQSRSDLQEFRGRESEDDSKDQAAAMERPAGCRMGRLGTTSKRQRMTFGSVSMSDIDCGYMYFDCMLSHSFSLEIYNSKDAVTINTKAAWSHKINGPPSEFDRPTVQFHDFESEHATI